MSRFLKAQALRLPQHAHVQLGGLATRLSASDSPVKRAKAARGLCLLALDLARGAAGDGAAAAVRIAAGDPAPRSVRNALGVLAAQLDSEPKTTPMRDHPAAHARFPKPTERSLRNQGLRLPPRARDYLEALTQELRADGAHVSTAAETIRGLLLLALEIAHGGAGDAFSAAFCLAAGDSTAEGQLRALAEVQQALGYPPSTTLEPFQPPEPAPHRSYSRLVLDHTVTDEDYVTIGLDADEPPDSGIPLDPDPWDLNFDEAPDSSIPR